MTFNVRDYRVYVEPLVEKLGGGFVSYAPELPGCVSDGATPDEALHNIYDAIECWIEAAVADGQTVPRPTRLRQHA